MLLPSADIRIMAHAATIGHCFAPVIWENLCKSTRVQQSPIACTKISSAEVRHVRDQMQRLGERHNVGRSRESFIGRRWGLAWTLTMHLTGPDVSLSDITLVNSTTKSKFWNLLSSNTVVWWMMTIKFNESSRLGTILHVALVVCESALTLKSHEAHSGIDDWD